MKLKVAADELGIIYSTAKTIWQTFKKERRIAKRPKRSIGTKKSAKHEEHLYSVLDKSRVPALLEKVLQAEFNPRVARKRPLTKKASTFCCAPCEEINMNQLRAPAIPLSEGPTEACISRSQSAATLYKEASSAKKDKFYIYTVDDLDEKYKEVVECSSPVSLRKPRKKTLPSFEAAFAKALGASRCNSEISGQSVADTCALPMAFNFSNYGASIVTRAQGPIAARSAVKLPSPVGLVQATALGSGKRTEEAEAFHE